jgi:hypothetical protein
VGLLLAGWIVQASFGHAGELPTLPPARPLSGPLLDPPGGDDYSWQSLAAYQERLEAHYGGYREIPLDVKAAYFQWELLRYHLTPYHQVYNRAFLPAGPGEPPQWFPGGDSSTWNGALMAALSFQYAATKDPAALAAISEVVRGMHLFFEVTGQPGLMARSVSRIDGLVVEDQTGSYTTADGVEYRFLGNPAKGGYNQIAGGYAALMMHAYDDLPGEIQQLARADMTAMVLHLIDHDYRATNRDGSHTSWGDLRPLIGSISLPFNAQVAYQIVALGYCFPPDDPAQRDRIVAEFVRLRGKHHVYYEAPLRNLVPPQRIGGGPLVKGMNDRNHVTNAAFIGLALELDQARRQGREPDGKFLYELGQTMVHSMDYLWDKHNSLCTFMWAGILSDPRAFATIVRRKPNTTRTRLVQSQADAVEQLRRFRLDRFLRPGRAIKTEQVQWCDTFQPDDYLWKCDPYLVVEPTGPATNACQCAIDYLYAYWLMRYYRLDAEGGRRKEE